MGFQLLLSYKILNVENLPFRKKIVKTLPILFLMCLAFFITIPLQSAYAVSYTFSSPFLNLSSDNTGTAPQILVSGSNVFVVWKDTGTSSGAIFYERSTDGGATFNGGTTSTPGAPVNLSGSTTSSSNPKLAISGSNVYVVWQGTFGGNPAILYQRSTDNGATFNGGTTTTPGAPINLRTFSSPSTGSGLTPQIAATSSSVYVVWSDSNPGNNDIFYERSTDSGNTFNGGTSSTPGTPVNLSSNTSVSTAPQIAISGSNVYIVWQDTSPFSILYQRSTDGGATFNGGSPIGTPTNLRNISGAGPITVSSIPQIAVSGTNVYVIWKDTATGAGDIYYERSTDSGNTFNGGTAGSPGASINVSTVTTLISTAPQIAASGSYVHIVWQDSTTGAGDIYYERSTDSGATFNGGSPVGAIVNLSNNAGASTVPQIAASGSNVYVVWKDLTANPGKGDVYFSVSNDNGATFNGGSPGAPVNVTTNPSTITPNAPVVSASGTVVYVAWQQGTSPNNDVYFSRGATSSISVSLDKQQYTLGNTATLTVTSLASPPATTIQTTVTSTTDATGISVTLTETGTNTGIYTGQFAFTTGSSSGTSLHASPGDTITAIFNSQSGTASIYTRTVAFGFASYTMSSTAGITVTDQNSVTNPSVVETIPITVSSTSTPTGVPLTLTETGAGTGVFTSSNLIFTTGTALFHIGDTATITQTETNGGQLTDNTIDTLPVSVTSTSDPVGITMTLTETKVNTGSFAAHLAFTTGSSSSSSTPNAIKVANGDIVSVTYLSETAHGLVIPNPNSGLNALPTKIGDTITASYLGSTGTAIINLGSGGGGGGGGLLRPGLVLDVVVLAGVVGGGAPSSPPVFFDPSSIPMDSLPKDVKNSILYPDPTKPILPIINSQIDTPLTIDGEGFFLPLHANAISTVTETTDKPFHLKLKMQDPYEITHVSFFTNLPGQTSQITDGDTAIIYDKDKPLMVLDPHHIFSNVTLAPSEDGNKYTFDYTITFAKPMKKSDIYIRSWNSILSSSDQDILDALQVNASANPLVENKIVNNTTSPVANKTTPTSSAVSNITTKPDVLTAIKEWGGYSPTSISDEDLLNTIGIQGHHIPSWFMKTTKWLVGGSITQDDFVNAIKYMQQMKMVK